jgi:hypothetical protein
MKSSSPTPTPSNSRTISGSAANGIAPACTFVRSFTVLVIAVGGRKDAEVAGRACMCGIETGALRNVEATRPVAVTGRVGGFICGGFLVGPAIRVGATRTASSRFEGR